MLPIVLYGQNSWESLDGPYDETWITAITVNTSGTIFAGTDRHGIYSSNNNGESWEHLGLSQNSITAIIIDSNNTIFIGAKNKNIGYYTYYGGLWRSDDNGQNFIEIEDGLPTLYEYVNISSMWLSDLGNLIVSTRSNSLNNIFITYNEGDSWEPLNLEGPSIDSIFLNSQNYIFASRADGVFRSTDNGNSWIEVSNGLPISLYWSRLTISNSDIVYLLDHNNGVYESVDNGNSWNNVFANIYPLRIVTTSINNIYLSTNSGIYFSSDEGANWNPFNDGFDTPPFVYSFYVDENDYIFAGTAFQGVYKTTNSTSIISNEIPLQHCILSQNFPNPFNPTTTIEFSILNNSKIKLSIYNIKGQKIKTLANNNFTKGSHSIIWNGDDDKGYSVSSGLYLFKINVNGKTEAVKKCLLLK